MAKPEWGTKRICPSCGTRYYDLLRDPVVCPKCATPFDPEAFLKSRRAPPRDAGREGAGARRRRRDRCRGRETEEETDVEAADEEGGGGAARRSRGGGRGTDRGRLRTRRGRGRHGRGHRRMSRRRSPEPAGLAAGEGSETSAKEIAARIFPLWRRPGLPIFPARAPGGPHTAASGPREIKRYGAIAQLGERYNGIVEVTGSIPLGSTN